LAISKARKEELVAQYKELIEKSSAIFVASYGGMTVKEMEALRAKVREADGVFYVTKNTLLELALRETNTAVPADLLNGPMATGFAFGEPPMFAKVLAEFAKGKDNLTVKGGILDNATLTAEQVDFLAKLPSLDELRGQIIGLISVPAQNVAATIANGVRQIINVVDAYAKSEESAAEAAAETA